MGGFTSIIGTGQILLTQDGQLGANYCTANPNTSGQTGTVTASGSAFAADNDVLLTAERLPMNSFGFFVVSLDQGFSPLANGSSDGNLCLGGTIGRYSAPMNVGNSGTSGTFSLRIDLTEIPQGGPTLSVQPGQSLNFQAWHRDSSARGSNFTNGLEITFM